MTIPVRIAVAVRDLVSKFLLTKILTWVFLKGALSRSNVGRCLWPAFGAIMYSVVEFLSVLVGSPFQYVPGIIVHVSLGIVNILL